MEGLILVSTLMTNTEIYDILLLFQSLNEMKRSFLMVLAHIYPLSLSIKELLLISGYSSKSKQIFRTETLQSMELEGLIIIRKGQNKSIKIKLNENDEKLMKLANICENEGKLTTELLLGKLLNE